MLHSDYTLIQDYHIVAMISSSPSNAVVASLAEKDAGAVTSSDEKATSLIQEKGEERERLDVIPPSDPYSDFIAANPWRMYVSSLFLCLCLCLCLVHYLLHPSLVACASSASSGSQVHSPLLLPLPAFTIFV